jgi:hypothetical protein
MSSSLLAGGEDIGSGNKMVAQLYRPTRARVGKKKKALSNFSLSA